MHQETRQHYNQFLRRIAELNHTEDASQRFHVAPSVEQRLVEKIKEQHPFLSAINHVMVDAQEGEKVLLGSSQTIASRTDTQDGSKEREPQAPYAISKDGFRCEKTNYDTYISYAMLDAWRHRPDFQRLLRQATSKQIARDRLMIGFNGVQVAATTNRQSHPLLQDVNKGWLHHIQTQKAAAVMADKKIGSLSDKDYSNLDAAVFDAVNHLIEPWHRDDDLIVICGSKLISQKYFQMINRHELPSERKALEDLMLQQSLGGLRTLVVPFFPADALLITKLNNLSLYTQRGSTRLYYADNPKKDRIEEYRSLNEAYVVEDYDACALLTGIKVPNADGSAWV